MGPFLETGDALITQDRKCPIALPSDSGGKQRRELEFLWVRESEVVLVLEARVLRSQHQEGIVSLG